MIPGLEDPLEKAWHPTMVFLPGESHPDAGKDWGQEEKGTTEDEMARWHH